MCFLLLTIGLSCGSVSAQRSIEITGDRLSGIVLPIEPLADDITIDALRAWSWTVDDTKRLLVEGDVAITIGSNAFVSSEAVVWINRLPSEGGLINQIAIYFRDVENPSSRAGLGVHGGPLLVTGSARGDVSLHVALMRNAEPRNKSIVTESEKRLANHLKRLLATPPTLSNQPQVTHVDPRRDPFRIDETDLADEEKLDLPGRIELPVIPEAHPWLGDPQGFIRFTADEITIASGTDENTIIATGSLAVEFVGGPDAGDLTQFTMTAERAVIFSDPGPLEAMARELDAESVRGIYLEGNVSVIAQRGEYTIRSPHVYYDFQRQEAIMLDALLRVYNRDYPAPVFARAEEMRQLAQNQWQAKRVRISMSEFHTPHIAIGAKEVTITNRPPSEEGGETVTHFDSRGNTLRFGGVPVIYWPRFSGTVEDIPLRSAEIGSRDNDGIRLLTKWDLFALTGKDAPPGVEMDLNIDGFTNRGAGGGVELRYDNADGRGEIELYGLHDDGIDRTSSGREVISGEEFRGIALLEHHAQLSQHWTLQAQGSYIGDETFVTAWREDDFTERREYETSLYLKHQHDNAALTALAKYSLNDFLSNDYLLASRQYAVDKFPEFTYRRYGDSFFDDQVTYSMENRVSRMRLVFQETTSREIGVRSGTFGLGLDDPIDAALFAAGLRTGFVNRFDSRHELAIPTRMGIFNVTPFLVGRLTGYDDEFQAFSSNEESTRLFGAAGVRVNTQFQKIDDNAHNRMLDIHRLRHIVEPFIVAWHGYTDVSQTDLPEYDPEVESLTDGTAVEVGVRNTWQTQRGGPGQWRSVDVLTLDSSVVLDSEGSPNESPTPQFFDYRPEYSHFGDHIRASGIWLVSDSLSLVGEGTYALDPSVLARGSIGAELRHSPLLRTFVEYRIIDASNNELLDVGWAYELTPKYNVSFSPQWDFRRDEFRSINFRVTRAFPDFDLTVQLRHDQIRDDLTLGASLGIAEF